MRYAFVFVCQAGELEVQAMLLAASLRRHLQADHQLVAALPGPEGRWGRPREETLHFLRGLGVGTASITNQIDPDYPIGNKVSCLMVDVAADVTIFVDTDVVCLQPVAQLPELHAPFAAKPADFHTFRGAGAHGDQWEAVYRSCGLAMPAARMRATVSGEAMPPYFNAGFIASRAARELGGAWVACCRRLDADPAIRNKRPWLDQIALPVAVTQLGLDYRCLDDRFNFPCHVRRIDPRRVPIFAHYHGPRVLRRDPVLRRQCRELSRAHRPLADAFARFPAWRWLRYPPAVVELREAPARVLEGIARLARRLDRTR
jgi:hypothetical protein